MMFASGQTSTVLGSDHEPKRLDDSAVRLVPGLAAPAAAAFLVLLDHEYPFFSEQDDVFVAEHAFSSASRAGHR